MAPREAGIVDLVPSQPAVVTVSPASLAGIVEELAAYHAYFAPCFHYQAQRQWSEVYLRGLLVADVPRKNIEAVALRLLGAGEAADRQVRASTSCWPARWCVPSGCGTRRRGPRAARSRAPCRRQRTSYTGRSASAAGLARCAGNGR